MYIYVTYNNKVSLKCKPGGRSPVRSSAFWMVVDLDRAKSERRYGAVLNQEVCNQEAYKNPRAPRASIPPAPGLLPPAMDFPLVPHSLSSAAVRVNFKTETPSPTLESYIFMC
eukprot:SAG31_NODE_52_length_30366_cov_34.368586_15_plen_113_part_00